MTLVTDLDPTVCYRAVSSRDTRFDGVFFTGVRTTGIYCRPSCPARTPAPGNVSFYPSAAAAQASGFRACKRCSPDAVPGSPDWDVAGDVAGRAMRLIADGVVDREGVDGVARRIGYSTRHLNRLLLERLGAGPLALARARRAQTARILLQSTDLPVTEVAFAAGFASVRQFNATVQEVYATTPGALRGGAGSRPSATDGVSLRLAVRGPFAGAALLGFLALRAVPGVEVATPTSYARTLRLPRGSGTVELTLGDHPGPGTHYVPAVFRLTDLRDLPAAVERVRRLLDADCDPVAVGAALVDDPLLAPLVTRWPGLRVPGHVDGGEVATRAVLGQQVSVAGARTQAARLAEEHGEPVASDVAGLDRLFPGPESLAALDPAGLAMPRVRAGALVGVNRALADGVLRLDRGADREETLQTLRGLPGWGPWTADYVGMRALGHPDLLLERDVGTRQALERLGADPAAVAALARPWRPWRSYAQVLLWQTLTLGEDG